MVKWTFHFPGLRGNDLVKSAPEKTVQVSRKINEFDVNPSTFLKLDRPDAISIPNFVKLFQDFRMNLRKELKNQKKMKLYYM